MKPKHLTLVLWIAVSLWLVMMLNSLGDPTRSSRGT